MNSKNQILIDNIKFYRKLKGWTQQDLANRLPGVSRSSIGSYEEGRAFPSYPTMVKMVQLFDLDNFEELIQKRSEKHVGQADKKKGFYDRYRILTSDKKKIVDFILNS